MFERLFNRSQVEPEEKSHSLADDDLRSVFGIQTSSAGIPVGEAGAMSCSASRACIRLICETVADLPVHLYKKNADGTRDRASDHPAEALVSKFSSPWQSASSFRRDLTYAALMNPKGGFARVLRVRNKVRELQPIPNGAVERKTDSRTNEPSYTIKYEGGASETLGWNEVLDLRPLAGRSITSDAKNAIALSIVLESHASKLFGKGAKPSGVLKYEGKLSKEAAMRIRASWEAQHAGDNSSRTAVLEEGFDFQGLTLASTDAQHLENRKHQVEEICRFYGVPGILVQDYGRATWGNSEQVGRLFLQHGMMPWLQLWQDAFSICLLTPKEREDHFFEFSTDALTKGDLAGRFEAFSKAVGGPWLAADEVRKVDNMPPIDGGATLRTPLNTAPAGGSADE